MATQVYKNKIGTRLPSVTSIIGRFKDSGGLIHWAWQLGIDGKDYRAERDKAANAGTLAHQMVEAHLRGEEWSGEADPELIGNARAAYSAYLTWEKTTKLEIKHSEVSLTSAKHDFGGTLDAIGEVDGKLVLLDWKSSNAIYQDYLIQLAAYGALWEENYPTFPITGGYHLCRFSKEGGDFSHHHYPKLDDAWEAFKLMRRLYDLDKQLKKRAA